MKRLAYLISTFLILTGMYGGNVGAESWQDRAARKAPWSAEFPDDPACWNPEVAWDTENPWVVGKTAYSYYGDHELNNCFRACAANNTCNYSGWEKEGSKEGRGVSEDVEKCRQRLFRGLVTTIGRCDICTGQWMIHTRITHVGDMFRCEGRCTICDDVPAQDWKSCQKKLKEINTQPIGLRGPSRSCRG